MSLISPHRYKAKNKPSLELINVSQTTYENRQVEAEPMEIWQGGGKWPYGYKLP
jgi:hypothetical protein